MHLADMMSMQAEACIVVEPPGQKTNSVKRFWAQGLSLEPCKGVDSGAQWTYWNVLDLPGPGSKDVRGRFDGGT